MNVDIRPFDFKQIGPGTVTIVAGYHVLNGIIIDKILIENSQPKMWLEGRDYPLSSITRWIYGAVPPILQNKDIITDDFFDRSNCWILCFSDAIQTIKSLNSRIIINLCEPFACVETTRKAANFIILTSDTSQIKWIRAVYDLTRDLEEIAKKNICEEEHWLLFFLKNHSIIFNFSTFNHLVQDSF